MSASDDDPTAPAGPDLSVRYGYIGLGQMGSAMARWLIGTGAHVTVHDLDESAQAAVVAAGGHPAASPAEVAAASDIISVCVPAARHLEAVLTGPAGIGSAAVAGQVVLVHSTVGPDTIVDCRSVVEGWGGELFDACVGGGAAAANKGELVVFAGGVGAMPPAVVALLDTYGSCVIDGGTLGGGAALKLAFNVMTYAQFAAAAAAFDIVGRAGADTKGLVTAWRHAGQLGTLTEAFLGLLSVPPEHLTGSFRDMIESSMSIAEKDLELARALLHPDSARQSIVASLRDAMPEVFGLAPPTNP